VAELVRRLPSIDILINNLGIFKPVAFPDISDAEWQQFFEVNVMSGVRLSRHYLRGMLAKNWGRIVFISSESAYQIPAEMVHYGFTKTAQVSIARGIAESVAGSGITVNSVLPGPTRSEGVGVFIEDMATAQQKTAAQVETEFFQNVRPSSLIKRLIEPVEIADMVAFVASPRAAAINGAAVRVEGGVVRSI
jgi:NAD(P)-dependent dehydrogenase (short-subunit alcohol dehydrogenase family)